MNYLPYEEYRKIIKTMPIFCIDFLITCKNRFLLIKREEEPLKNEYWVIGGRLMFRETIKDAAKRIQQREIGRYYLNFKEIGFSNYFFPNKLGAKATHTPAILFKISVQEEFIPIVDKKHSNFIWSNKMPIELIKQTTFFDFKN